MDELESIRAKKLAQYRRLIEKKDEKKEDVKMDVKVYSTPTCPYCTMAKRYLDSKGVKYKDINVAADMAAAQEMVMKSGQMGVPQLEINGRIIIGFDRAGIDAALAGQK